MTENAHGAPSPLYALADRNALVRAGEDVVLPAGGALHRLTLEVIANWGLPCHLAPLAAVRAVAAFAAGADDDPAYSDGQVLLRAAVARRRGYPGPWRDTDG